MDMMSDLRHKHLFFFHEYWDFDGDGTLTWDDFNLMAEKYAVYQKRGEWDLEVVDKWRQIIHGWWDALVKEADTNEDDTVDFSEWLAYFERLCEHSSGPNDLPAFLKGFLQLFFRSLDYDRNGSFDIKEYRLYLANYNMDVSRADECFNAMLNEEDKKNGNCLSENRFYQLLWEFLVSGDPSSPGRFICGPYDSYPIDLLERKCRTE